MQQGAPLREKSEPQQPLSNVSESQATMMLQSKSADKEPDLKLLDTPSTDCHPCTNQIGLQTAATIPKVKRVLPNVDYILKRRPPTEKSQPQNTKSDSQIGSAKVVCELPKTHQQRRPGAPATEKLKPQVWSKPSGLQPAAAAVLKVKRKLPDWILHLMKNMKPSHTVIKVTRKQKKQGRMSKQTSSKS